MVLWTNHRVMEWLRQVDLAEYAPNLRGAGVHGGLMVCEPKFNAELLAALLAISSSKTLLRRHLSIHFADLVGREVMGEKRKQEADAEAGSGSGGWKRKRRLEAEAGSGSWKRSLEAEREIGIGSRGWKRKLEAEVEAGGGSGKYSHSVCKCIGSRCINE